MRVLVVEDEPKVTDALREGLEAEGYDIVVEGTGEGAFYRTITEAFDLSCSTSAFLAAAVSIS